MGVSPDPDSLDDSAMDTGADVKVLFDAIVSLNFEYLIFITAIAPEVAGTRYLFKAF